MIKLGLYQHWQGTFHQVTAVVPHEDTGVYHVVHRAMTEREPQLSSLDAFTRQEEGCAGEPVARFTFMGDDEQWTAAMADVFSGVLADAQARRQASEGYQHLFTRMRDGGMAAALSEGERQMKEVVLNLGQVLEQQSGAPLPAPAYDLLLGLPLMQAVVRRDITQAEGTSCCAGKTRFLIRHYFYQLLGVTPEAVASP